MPFLREAHPFLAQTENAQRRIVSKGVNTASGGVNQHGRGAVYHVNLPQPVCYQAGGSLLPLPACQTGVSAAVDGENWLPTETLTSSWTNAIQWVHQHHVFLACSQPSKTTIFIFFFRGNARNDIACFQCGFQFFISEQVEFLLNLALHVLSTAGTQDINQSCFVDIAMD